MPVGDAGVFPWPWAATSHRPCRKASRKEERGGCTATAVQAWSGPPNRGREVWDLGAHLLASHRRRATESE